MPCACARPPGTDDERIWKRSFFSYWSTCHVLEWPSMLSCTAVWRAAHRTNRIAGGAPMSILYLLIPLAVILMVVAVAFFMWTIKSGQYEDLEGPAHRILMDDDDPMIPKSDRSKTSGDDESKK
jgi:cbb3-type cytochrome oxidase maturation protein